MHASDPESGPTFRERVAGRLVDEALGTAFDGERRRAAASVIRNGSRSARSWVVQNKTPIAIAAGALLAGALTSALKDR